jgi:hypothetical protein
MNGAPTPHARPTASRDAERSPAEVFSTANWFLPNGRSARSAASMIHCERAESSKFRRAILNLVGKLADD